MPINYMKSDFDLSGLLGRSLLLMRMAGPKALSENGETPVSRWKNIGQGRARLGTEELETLARMFPAYQQWLLTGVAEASVAQTTPHDSGEVLEIDA
ncbi:DNA-binding protein [Pseudomonas entomophila]|uniref:DNA-binding protein n=1 Tax=Pseudomonas entomophila TaxID=312306 RepID=UPI0020104113|nr:DNA-binding protein [Pseudomonas entomophila]